MISLRDVEQARKTIAGIAKETPILESKTLSTLCGNRIFIKSEHLQTTGAFKIRGATNKVKQVVRDGCQHVIAASSGNHGQAVAYIAKELGIKATIVVPEDATRAKVDAIEGYGADIIYCGNTSHERIEKAIQLAKENHATFIPPYDDPLIIAGQGTVGLEILEQVSDVDVIYVPIGGGGLISGVLTAVKEIRPEVQVIGVEPDTANDTYLSLKKGSHVTIPATKTIADGLRTNRPGELTLPVLQKYIDDLVLVSEEDIKKAFCFALQRMKQLIEPSGCVAIAAAMKNHNGFHRKKIVSVASGGNMAIEQISSLI